MKLIPEVQKAIDAADDCGRDCGTNLVALALAIQNAVAEKCAEIVCAFEDAEQIRTAFSLPLKEESREAESVYRVRKKRSQELSGALRRIFP